MSGTEQGGAHFVQFYSTASYPCSYLPQERARSQVAISGERMDANTFSQLIYHGFRRSGLFIYRPHCDHCRACVPVRIPVEQFHSNRSQRRTFKRLSTLRVQRMPLTERAEHYYLYQRYQRARHPGGGMDEDGYEQYRSFLLKTPVRSQMLEFRREDGRLVMVSVIDLLSDGWSAVYTFFEPDEPHAGYGVYNVLWQIEALRQEHLPYLYLGYWIRDCRKMRYKAQYQPLEALEGGIWQPFPQDDPALAGY